MWRYNNRSPVTVALLLLLGTGGRDVNSDTTHGAKGYASRSMSQSNGYGGICFQLDCKSRAANADKIVFDKVFPERKIRGQS
jgi:hypothetical protein